MFIYLLTATGANSKVYWPVDALRFAPVLTTGSGSESVKRNISHQHAVKDKRKACSCRDIAIT